jgi:predicted nucleic acid-binding Zn ribbon protein
MNRLNRTTDTLQNWKSRMNSICAVCTTAFTPTRNTKGLYCSHACAGKARTNRSRETKKSRYDAAPCLCKNCKSPISYDQHRIGGQFCSRSCSVTFNNRAKTPKVSTPRYCIHCESTISGAGKYCSNSCQQAHLYERNTLPKFLAGMAVYRPLLRKVLIKEYGHQCQQCNETVWRGLPIPLEVHHRDGNAANNNPENVVLWCPNCHAQDPTSRGANRGNGRKSRGIPTWR